MDKKIIYKYLTGTSTPEEEQTLLDWLHQSPDNQITFYEIKAIWNIQRQFPAGNENKIAHSLQQLNNRIDTFSKQTKKTGKKVLFGWKSVAAIILIAFVTSYIYYTEKTIIDTDPVLYSYMNNTEKDSIISVLLPDGTEVWLAYQATLSYPEKFSANQREVHLDGEAFFDVTKDSQHPFIVKTDVTEIKVLGTSFSVNSHTFDKRCEAILRTGSIQLKRIGGESVVTLHPGQQALYSKETKAVEIKEVDANTLTSWRFGLTSMNNVSITDILKCLESTYNIKIKMDTESIKSHKYNFSFKRSKGPASALHQLNYITGITATII